MELWAWNQWKQGRIQNRSARMPRIVRVRAGWRQCEPSLACVHCARGFLGSCLSWGRERSSFSLLELLQTCHCHCFFSPRPNVFLSLWADWYPSAAETQRYVTQHTVWFWKALTVSAVFFRSVPHLPVSFLPPLLKIAKIGEELTYNHRSTPHSLH